MCAYSLSSVFLTNFKIGEKWGIKRSHAGMHGFFAHLCGQLQGYVISYKNTTTGSNRESMTYQINDAALAGVCCC